MGRTHIDFNVDLAQVFGAFKDEKEFQALDYVSSAYVSCGFHAGDPLSIREMLLRCKEKNICIGAHVGYNDLQGFGYRPIALSPSEIEAIVIYQIGALTSLAKSYSLTIENVRPHGALYRLCALDYDIAMAVVSAIKKFDKWLSFTCLDNPVLDKVAAETGIVVNREVLLDKPYRADASVDWNSNSFLPDEVALNRVRTIMHSSQIKLPEGKFLPVNCDTLHFSIKNPTGINLLKSARELVEPTPVAYNRAELSGWV